ncbi:TetR/AcrR family transcriptional regulator [Falsirhodobacter deserti]|uniref:TetR/AcrR family transcriptional regulator n=1 Tax=Falsirhodobacter deserti TaxID=1365611 RepID=UPI000FE3416A|nr:TetR/AcrR family transcriptional regulator [Falsirhodobacter deserti]
MRKPNPASQAAQRAQLIHAAKRCFSRSGFDGTSTDAVRLEAKTSSGKLFHYFPNKQALIHAVVADNASGTIEWLNALKGQQDAGLALRQLLSDVVAAAADPEIRRLILEISAATARDATIAKLSAEADRAMIEALSALIDRQDRPFAVPRDEMIALLSTWIDGVFSRAAADPFFDPEMMTASMHSLLAMLQNHPKGHNDV